jgi:hypothetical protein
LLTCDGDEGGGGGGSVDSGCLPRES